MKEYTREPKKYAGSTFISTMNDPPKNIPYKHFKIRASVKPVVPKGKPGNFFSETLNFSAKYTVPRLVEGLKAGIAFAEDTWPDLVKEKSEAILRIEHLISDLRTTKIGSRCWGD